MAAYRRWSSAIRCGIGLSFFHSLAFLSVHDIQRLHRACCLYSCRSSVHCDAPDSPRQRVLSLLIYVPVLAALLFFYTFLFIAFVFHDGL